MMGELFNNNNSKQDKYAESRFSNDSLSTEGHTTISRKFSGNSYGMNNSESISIFSYNSYSLASRKFNNDEIYSNNNNIKQASMGLNCDYYLSINSDNGIDKGGIGGGFAENETNTKKLEKSYDCVCELCVMQNLTKLFDDKSNGGYSQQTNDPKIQSSSNEPKSSENTKDAGNGFSLSSFNVLHDKSDANSFKFNNKKRIDSLNESPMEKSDKKQKNGFDIFGSSLNGTILYNSLHFEQEGLGKTGLRIGLPGNQSKVGLETVN